MNSKIEFLFGVDPPVAGESFSFSDSLTGLTNTFTYFDAVDYVPGPGNLLVSTLNTTAASIFAQHINNYFNAGLIYQLQTDFIGSNAKVIITALNAFANFTEITNTTGDGLTMVITNVFFEAFNITNVTVSEADSNPCANVKVTVTTSQQATSIASPISQTVSSNPFVFTIPRANLVPIIMFRNGVLSDASFRIPLLLGDYFDIVVVGTPTGSSITIYRENSVTGDQGQYPLLLEFEYTFDGGTTWQTANSQSGFPPGVYNVGIRDNIGCEYFWSVPIDEFVPNLIDFDPLCEISNINSIAVKEYEEWANCGPVRNVKNTLSHEERSQVNNRNFQQIFQKCDVAKMQIKSNYDTHTAKLIDCDANEIDINVIKVTDNMNKIDVRDATAITIGAGGALQLRFGAGNTYDPDTQQQNGTYNLGTGLPSWLNAGDYILVEGVGWVLIQEVVAPESTDNPFFTEPYSYYRVKTFVNSAAAGISNGQVLKITSYYNTVNYDRFQLAVPFSTLEGFYQLQITATATDPSFPDKLFISEWLDIREHHAIRHHIIDYYNSEINEINFATGIGFRLRIPYVLDLKWKPVTEQDTYVTDTRTITVENKYRSFWTLYAKPLPSTMAEKLVLALSQDRLQIDSLNYKLEGEVESISLGSTNTYVIKATLVRSDYVFESRNGLTGAETLLPAGTPLSINSNSNGLLLINN